MFCRSRFAVAFFVIIRWAVFVAFVFLVSILIRFWGVVRMWMSVFYGAVFVVTVALIFSGVSCAVVFRVIFGLGKGEEFE